MAQIVEWFIIFVAVLFVIGEAIELLSYLVDPWKKIVAVFLWLSISIWYYFQWDNWVDKRKEREKPQIRDEINYAIVPLITQLKIETPILKRRHSNRQPFSDIDVYLEKIKIFQLSGKTNEIMREISIQRMRNEYIGFLRLKKFGSKIDARNKLVETLREALEELTDELVPMVKEYNSTVREEKDRINLGPKYAAIIPIIGTWKKLNTTNVLKDFWRDHGKELLRLRGLSKIKEQIEEVDDIVGELELLSCEMLEYLEQLKERYINKFRLLSDEIKAV